MASLAYAFASYNAVIVSVGLQQNFPPWGSAPAVLAGLVLLSQRRYLTLFRIYSYPGFQHAVILPEPRSDSILYISYCNALACWYSLRHPCNKKKKKSRTSQNRPGCACSRCMGMLSYAVILFPTYDYSKETMRGGRSELTQPGEAAGNKSKGGLDKDYAFAHSYGITEVLTIAVSRMYGGGSSVKFNRAQKNGPGVRRKNRNG